jgi:hypothetical protein
MSTGNAKADITTQHDVRGSVHEILLDWRHHEWQSQGFGMLRTYLPGEDEPRLQIWDQRIAVWKSTAIHDHPWSFTSTIIAGILFNQRYLRSVEANPLADIYNEVLITPGPHRGEATPDQMPPHNVWLEARSVEVYGIGEQYRQKWDELHETRYLPGTVTLLSRHRERGVDRASSIWRGDGGWISARPRTATVEEVEMVVSDCLRTWFGLAR